jgi:Fic family protein
MSALEKAGLALGQLNGIGRLLPNPHILVYPYLRREAVLSSRIEGTQATLSDVLFREASERSERGADVQEVLNYVAATEHGLRRLQDLPLCLNLIREVHERLLSGPVRGRHRAPGEFRRNQIHIGPAESEIDQATYVPPPVNEMLECLDAWERYVHADDGIPPLIRCAQLHYAFEAIHPFYDGNGRVGRVVIILYLIEQGLLAHPLLYLSAYFERDRDAYYDGLMSVSREGAWGQWFTYFLRGITEQASAAVADCERLLAMRRTYIDRLNSRHARPTTIRLVDHLFENPYVQTRSLSNRLNVSFAATQMAIDQLVEMGLLQEVTGQKRNRVYLAVEVLAAIEGTPPTQLQVPSQPDLG